MDDNPANLKLLQVLLAAEGYRVRTAGDAPSALAAIRRARPDLLLVDLGLPGMDGLELTRTLKSNPRTRRIVVIAVTAHAMAGDEERARAAGCDGYVAKPIDTRALPRILAGHLAAQSGGQP